jgi:hypothetical protein
MPPPNSRDSFVLTGREISQADEDAHERPRGMTAAAPIRIERTLAKDDANLIVKVKNDFRVIPTGASFFRSRTGRSIAREVGTAHTPLNLTDWASMFEPTQWSDPSTPPIDYDARTGELDAAAYAQTIGAGTLRRTTELVEDNQPFAGMTVGNVQALDVALSRDGRYTYSLFALNETLGFPFFTTFGAVWFVVHDNATGLVLQKQVLFSLGIGPVNVYGTARGSIAVVDDSTGESAPDLLFDDCVVAFQMTDSTTTYMKIFKLKKVAGPSWTASAPWGVPAAFPSAFVAPDAWAGVTIINAGETVIPYGIHVGYREDFGVDSSIKDAVYVPAGGAAFVITGMFGAVDLNWDISPVLERNNRAPGPIPGAPQCNAFYAAVIAGGHPFDQTIIFETIGNDGGVVVSGSHFADNILQRLEADPVSLSVGVGVTPRPVILAWGAQDAAKAAGTRAQVGVIVVDSDTAVVLDDIIITQGNVAAVRRLGCRIERTGIFMIGPGPIVTTTVAFAVITGSDALTGDMFWAEVRLDDVAGGTLTLAGSSRQPTGKNAGPIGINGLPLTQRGYHFDISRWTAATTGFVANDIQAIAYERADTLGDGIVRTTAPFAALLMEWNAREYERVGSSGNVNNPRSFHMRTKAQAVDNVGYKSGAKMRTLARNGTTGDQFDYTAHLLDGVNDLDTGAYLDETGDSATPPPAYEVSPAVIWPDDPITNPTGGIVADVSEVEVGVLMMHLTNIVWGSGDLRGAKLAVGHELRITSPPELVGRYNIENFVTDGNDVVIQMRLSPPPPAGTVGLAAIIVGTITAAPSHSLRQVLMAGSDPAQLRHSNAIFPAIFDAQFIDTKTKDNLPPLLCFDIPIAAFQNPEMLAVTIKVWADPDFGNFPPPNVAGIKVRFEPDIGTPSVNKPLSTPITTTEKPVLAPDTVFGFQSFNDKTQYGEIPGPFAAGASEINVGDFLTILEGPNKGVYTIQELVTDPSTPHRVIVDKAFPVQGAAGNPQWRISSAKEISMGGGGVASPYQLLSMFFDVAGLVDSAATIIRGIIECNDTNEQPVTYQIDNVTVQWS